jgi:hypothetical protein
MSGIYGLHDRIDNKCHVQVGFPFWIHACKTEVRVMPAAGGLRADFVKGPQTPHSTFLLDVRFHSHWNTGSPHRCGRLNWGVVLVPRSIASDVNTRNGRWARQIGVDQRQSVII